MMVEEMPKPSDSAHKEALAFLKEITDNGTLDSLGEMRDKETPVWIKRSSGAWQQVFIDHIGYGGLVVVVKWEDEATGEMLSKIIDTKDFLTFQAEHS